MKGHVSKNKVSESLGLAVLFLLGSCAPLGNLPIVNPSGAGQVQPQGTATIQSTFTPRPSVTPVPPPTLRPTWTGQPATPTSLTPFPSVTPIVSDQMLTEAANAGATPTQGVLVGIFTATPMELSCNVANTVPNFGDVVPPRNEFLVKWRVYNTGTLMWHAGDIIMDFVRGDKVLIPNKSFIYLPVTIYPNDKIDLQMHMMTPKESGTYTSFWGLRRTNKTDYFCVFSVTVFVPK